MDNPVMEPGLAAPMKAAEPIENTAYKDGVLTREGMVAIIRAGGSVMYKQSIIWREQDLPTSADLAAGDKVKALQVKSALGEQVQALLAQMAQLDTTTAEDLHISHKNVPMASGDVEVGTLGQGDTVGLGTGATDATDAQTAASAASAEAAKAKIQEEADAAKAAKAQADADKKAGENK